MIRVGHLTNLSPGTLARLMGISPLAVIEANIHDVVAVEVNRKRGQAFRRGLGDDGRIPEAPAFTHLQGVNFDTSPSHRTWGDSKLNELINSKGAKSSMVTLVRGDAFAGGGRPTC